MVQQFTKDIIVAVFESGHSQTMYLSIELLATVVSIVFCVLH